MATVFGLPLVVCRNLSPAVERGLIIGFGVGLALVLDEWVYLIVTDGSNAAYLLLVSFWGGVTGVGAAAVYVALLGRISR